MTSGLRGLTAAGAALVAAMTAAGAAYAQKSGGVLRVHALELAAEPIDARGG